MTEGDAAAVLLVRAIEESDRDAVSPDAVVEAVVAAGEPDDASAWFARRAHYLLRKDLGKYRSLLLVAQVPTGGWLVPLGVPMLIGLAANYLGPSQRIHVLANPIMLLLAWNLFVYTLLVVHFLVGQSKPRPKTAVAPVPSTATATEVAAVEPPPSERSLVQGLVMHRVLAWWLALRTTALARKDRVVAAGAVTRRFTQLWLDLMSSRLAHSLHRVFHLGAIGLTIGAIVGMYLRGLFFEYAMVWRSTFITSPTLIAGLLDVVLQPACWLLGQAPPSPADATALLSPEGLPAAHWIHLYALSALLIVLIPRSILALIADRHLTRARGRVQLPIVEPYYLDTLDHARRLQIQRVRDEIHDSVTDEIDGLADNVATLVAEQLFDTAIVERVRRFREEGGTVSALERDLEDACREFQPQLAARLPGLLGKFETAVLHRVEERLGRTLGSHDTGQPDLAHTIGSSAVDAARDMSLRIGAGATDLLGVTVTGAVGAVAAVVSGGIGHHLGIAIVAALLHTSGPVGLLLGGVAGLLVAGVGWWQGRDQITNAMKDVPLPGMMVRMALWTSRFESLVQSGRDTCMQEVRGVVRRELAPLTDAIAAQIWARVRPVLGARAR